MVGQTQEPKHAQSIDDLITEFGRRILETKTKKAKLGEQMLALEKEYAALEAAELAWDRAKYELENLGKPSGPKRRSRPTKEEDEEEEDEGKD